MTLLSRAVVSLLLGAWHVGATAAGSQRVLSPAGQRKQLSQSVDPAIITALKTYPDPVDAFVSLRPDARGELFQPRLLHVAGDQQPKWMTEGDKMRLRRQGKKFIDITDYEEFYAEKSATTAAGEAHTPDLAHQHLVKPLFQHISQSGMRESLEHLTSFYTRYFDSTEGEKSAQWLHDQIAEIITNAPFHTHISLSFFTHSFAQPSVIARFEPKVANFSAPLTIVGSHQDSMNYLFPLLPSPGADDDGSGTVTILEVFRILATSGFVPKNGPVEFHWYAGEEGGNLGSQPVAKYKKESGARIGAMMEFDMVAYVARNATETMGIIETMADESLNKWVMKLAHEYISIPAEIYELPGRGASDYMSYTKLGYPATFATEGNPGAEGGGIFGEYDPYIHTAGDVIDVDDETGRFSFEHMARFAELGLAFVVEQAGWDNKWR